MKNYATAFLGKIVAIKINCPIGTKHPKQCIAIIHRLDDNDDKLVIVPENTKEISDNEIFKAVSFQEKWFNSVVVR